MVTDIFTKYLPDETSFIGHSSYSARQITMLRDVSSYPVGVSKRAECEPESEIEHSSLLLVLKLIKSSRGPSYTAQDTIVGTVTTIFGSFIAEWAFFQSQF